VVVEQALRTGESVRVIGHTDALTGSAAHNRRLSQRRADAVGVELVRLGLPKDQLEAPKGVGSQGASLSAEKADPAQVSRDRRVEITFGR
jgi:outer membrane protein OmpA-like peptidoglycan-associated protein